MKILTTHYKDEKAEQDVVRIGKVFYIPMNKSFATLSVGWNIPRAVKGFLQDERFDIIHTMGPFPPSISFFALHYSRAVNVTTFHSTGFKNYRFGSYLFRKIFKRYSAKLHGLIAVSETARDTFLPYIPGEYAIIPNGVDLERFYPDVPMLEEFKNRQNRILYLGRLDRRKGLIELLNALKIVKTKIKDVLLIVVGKGPLEDDCRKLVKKLDLSDAVIFKGYAETDAIPSYYASCDVYCSPALGGESFGIVLLEAMAVGKPVLASKIPGYDRVITDGYNGLFFNPLNPEEIAQKIILVLKNSALKNSLINNSKEFVKGYSWESVAKRVEEFYRQKLASFTGK